MDLPSISNAARELPLGGLVFRARTLTLADLGEVLAWLEERLPDAPARLSSDAARLALASTEGLAVVLHLACLSCHPGMTRAEARALAATMTPEDSDCLMSIAFRRRPSYEPKGEGEGEAKDLAEVDWGKVWEGLSQHRAWAYADVGRLTLDQYDNHVARGELAGPDTLSPAVVQRMWEEAQARPDDGLPPAEPIPEVLP